MKSSFKTKTRLAAAASLLMTQTVSATTATVPNPDTVAAGVATNTNKNMNSIFSGVNAIFGSAYSAVATIGVLLMIISIFFLAIQLATSGAGSKREEVKSRLIYVAVAGIGIGGVMAIASLILSLGAGL